MLRLLKFELNELSQRKSILRICLSIQLLLFIIMYLLPQEALLTLTIAACGITSMFMMYALGVTKSFAITPGTEKRKLLISFPVTRREFAYRTILLYTSYIAAQLLIVTIMALLASIKSPDILPTIPTLILGVTISLAPIVGIMFTLSIITKLSPMTYTFSSLLILSLLFYEGYLVGATAADASLPNPYICLISPLIYTIGLLIELLITPKID